MDYQPVTEKVLQESDVQTQQNRFLIPIADVRKRLLSLLTLDELRDANLLCLMTKKRKRYRKRNSKTDDGGVRTRKQAKVGRKHGGLAVRLVAGDREIGMTLTQWDGTLGAVLKGGAEWKIVVAEQNFEKGLLVELLAFRRRRATAVGKPGETDELCFLLRRKEHNQSDDDAAAEPLLEPRRQATDIDRSEPLDLSISLRPPAYSAAKSIDRSRPGRETKP